MEGALLIVLGIRLMPTGTKLFTRGGGQNRRKELGSKQARLSFSNGSEKTVAFSFFMELVWSSLLSPEETR